MHVLELSPYLPIDSPFLQLETGLYVLKRQAFFLKKACNFQVCLLALQRLPELLLCVHS